MGRYRSKIQTSIVVEAVQIIKSNEEAILAFMEKTSCPFEMTDKYTMVIHTPGGDIGINPGDWLVQSIMGDFYARRPDIFEAAYTPI